MVEDSVCLIFSFPPAASRGGGGAPYLSLQRTPTRTVAYWRIKANELAQVG